MPFNQRSKEIFKWEIIATQRNHFVLSIDSKAARDNWTRVLRVVQAGGFLIIRRYERKVGAMACPTVLRDVLLSWRQGQSVSVYPEVDQVLAQWLEREPPSTGNFCPNELATRLRPASVATYLRNLDQQGGATAILIAAHRWQSWFRRPCSLA
jgi:hypothetical protein